MPTEPEVHGLVALMELQASRFRARTDPEGAPVALLDQDRARWDWLLVGRGLAGAFGPYTLQAGIAACHARARVAEDTDWERIVALYDALAQLMPSPVVDLNRAVAVAIASGPEEGLELVDALVVRKHRHRNALVAADEDSPREGGRPEPIAHLVDRHVQRVVVAPVEGQDELDRVVVLEVGDGDADEGHAAAWISGNAVARSPLAVSRIA